MTGLELCSVDSDGSGLCLVDSRSLWLVIVPKSKDQFTEQPTMKTVRPENHTMQEGALGDLD
jgi:hypothetical protein